MPTITHKFKCEHHQAVLIGEPEFSMSERIYEWELDLSEMSCPKMPEYPDVATEEQIKAYDEEATKCVSSWQHLQVEREGDFTLIKELEMGQ
jgi:hypothetical protein